MSALIVGFYGKLPARGDFVRGALPREFTDCWDGWLGPAIAGSRERMGEDWLPAFLEAPVWRFRLAAGLCGERAALGLMLPSVDRAGRYFPLTFAALFGAGFAMADEAAWLDDCEAAGRAALERDVTPEQLGAMLVIPAGVEDLVRQSAPPSMHSIWWTDGAPRVPPVCFVQPGLPDALVYATMLGAKPDTAMSESTSGEVALAGRSAGGDSWEPPS